MKKLIQKKYKQLRLRAIVNDEKFYVAIICENVSEMYEAHETLSKLDIEDENIRWEPIIIGRQCRGYRWGGQRINEVVYTKHAKKRLQNDSYGRLWLEKEFLRGFDPKSRKEAFIETYMIIKEIK